MAEPFQSYHRTVKLPCEEIEGCRAHQKELDASVLKVARSLADASKQVDCEVDDDAAGHLNATLKTKTYKVSLQTQFGQNVVYLAGERRTFISYSVSVESRVPALDRAAETAERLRILLMMVGGLAGAGVVFAVVEAMLNAYHHAVIPRGLIAIALIFGGWCGGKLGSRLGVAVESLAIKRAEARGVTTEAETLWDTLIHELDGITSRYERA
jgi:hypothetical protein